MNALPELLVALNLGLFSQLHCMVMCGGVIGALTLAVDPALRQQRGMLPVALAYNAGRVLSYTVGGALVGALGAGLIARLDFGNTHLALRIIAGAALIAAGLSLLGSGRASAWLERGGLPLWRRLQRAGQSFVPVRSLAGALAFGMLWGWLPCALVYAALLTAAASGSGTDGAIMMLAFGLGTAPVMVATAVAGGALDLRRRVALRRLAGVLIIGFGLAYPFIDRISGQHHGEHVHDSPAGTAQHH